jgi:type III secretion protein V
MKPLGGSMRKVIKDEGLAMNGRLRYADVVLVALVVAITAMLIVPLPTVLLDVLLVVNISFSILLLLVGLYLPNSAALYTFPTILLLSTLFRLGLNVASSRLILSQGDAGRVIESFGTFLIRGEVVVGIIIFTIVTIVNFIVISKGASRVSEVAARFALDSLPGKQTAIDNDARSGVISADEARRKRDELRRDSQLYGSMDGAMKFVQGDAVAGFFIILTNILGGVYMGLSGGMSLADAVHSYTVLTVGDGLVTQIPGLLTSICAGIIVTRVSSTEVTTLSSDLRAQLFSQPVTLLITSAILLTFAMLPGVPAFPFVIVALAAATIGVVAHRRRTDSSGRDLSTSAYGRLEGSPSPLALGLRESPLDEPGLSLILDSGVLYRSYRSNPGKWMSWWRAFQSDFFADVGVRLPDIHVMSDELLPASSFRVTSSGVEMISGPVLTDALLVEMASFQAGVLGLSVLLEEDHPLSGNRVFWCRNMPSTRKMLEMASIRSFDFFEYIGLRVGSFCLRHPEEFLSVTDVHSLLRQVEKKHPGLIAEGFGKGFVTVPVLTQILHELVRQGISIRDFRSILESVASYCSSFGVSSDQDANIEVAQVVHYIRTQRKRQILRRYMGTSAGVRVLRLSEDVEQALQESEISDAGLPLAMDDRTFEALSAGLQTVLKSAFEFGAVPVAILCSSEVRAKVLSLARGLTRPLFVLSYEELDPVTVVEQIGTWEMVPR